MQESNVTATPLFSNYVEMLQKTIEPLKPVPQTEQEEPKTSTLKPKEKKPSQKRPQTVDIQKLVTKAEPVSMEEAPRASDHGETCSSGSENESEAIKARF